MARTGDGIRVDSTPRQDSGRFLGDHNPHTKDFLRQNDAHGKQVSESAASALHKMFNVDGNHTHIRADGQGKIATQLKDANGRPAGRVQIYDLNTLKPEERKQFEYQAKRHIVSEHVGGELEVEDINDLKEVGGKYYFKDRNGDHFVIEPNDTQREAINKDISSLGLDNNKQYIPDSVGKGILEHVANHETEYEKDPIARADLIKDKKAGTVHSYEYDKQNDQYKFYIMKEEDHPTGTGKTDGNMREVAIGRESLPSQVKNGLEYHERKLAVIKEFGKELDEIQDLKIVNGELHFKGIDGTPGNIKPTDAQWKNIEAHLDSKGFSNNRQQISDSIGKAAIKHAIGKETDQAKKDAIEGATVYDYSYDKKKKEHTYHIIKKDLKKDVDGKIEEAKDANMEKVSFTEDEHKALLDDAKLNAVRKYGQLADGTKITDDMVVDFDPNDKTKFVVIDNTSDKGEHTLTGDSDIGGGEKLGDAIIKELKVQPRVEADVLSNKIDVKVGTQGTDSQLEQLEKELEGYTKTTKGWLRALKILGVSNDMFLQAATDIGQLTAQMLHSQDTPNQQQPMGSVLTGATRDAIKKHIRHHREALQKKIDILKENPSSGKGSAVGKSIEHMQKQLEDIKKGIENNKNFTKKDIEDMLGKQDNNNS